MTKNRNLMLNAKAPEEMGIRNVISLMLSPAVGFSATSQDFGSCLKLFLIPDTESAVVLERVPLLNLLAGKMVAALTFRYCMPYSFQWIMRQLS